jgi:hypothetical protein
MPSVRSTAFAASFALAAFAFEVFSGRYFLLFRLAAQYFFIRSLTARRAAADMRLRFRTTFSAVPTA